MKIRNANERPESVSVGESIDTLRVGIPSQKTLAIEQLSATLNPAAVPHILHLTTNSPYEVRKTAFSELRSFHDERVVVPVINIVERDKRITDLKFEGTDGWFDGAKGSFCFKGNEHDLMVRIGRSGLNVSRQPLTHTLNISFPSDNTLNTNPWFPKGTPFGSISFGDQDQASPVSIAGNSNDVEVLHRIVKWGLPGLYEEAINTLGRTKDQRAVSTLIHRLSDPKASCRAAAAGALGTIGDARAYTPLLKASHDPDPEIRCVAAKGLCRLSEPRAIDRLLELMREDPNADVRQAVSQWIFCFKEDRVVSALVERLNDQNKWVRIDAVDALARIGDQQAVPPLLDAFRGASIAEQANIADALGTLGCSDAYDEVLAVFEKAPDHTKRTMVTALAEMNSEKSIPVLMKLIDSRNYLLRSAAFSALGDIKPKDVQTRSRIIQELIRASKNEKPFVRASAVSSLASFDDPHACKVLAQTLRDSTCSAWVRKHAAEALGRSGCPSALESLCSELQRQQEWLIDSILTGLRELNDSRCVDCVLPYLQHPNGSIRSLSAKVLGQTGNQSIVKEVLPLIEDTNLGVQTSAVKALIEIGVEQPHVIKKLRVVADGTNIRASSLAKDYLKSK